VSAVRRLALVLASAWAFPAAAGEPPSPTAPGIEQLHHALGGWRVETRFRQQDGTETRPFAGTYRFEWAVPDTVLRGASEIPELKQKSAILFYLRPANGEIEMVSVGAEGKLWVMTGKEGSEVRETADQATADGGTMRLRFTRFNVSPDRFESRMEWSIDKGATWNPGNHQIFRRCQPIEPC
jgi:hypothetical protein